MKKQLVLAMFLLGIVFRINAQITLEHKGVENLTYVKFSKAGDKYVQLDTGDIRIYNLDLSIYKVINPPAPLTPYSGHYTIFITDNLFNTDSKLEYLIDYNTAGSTGSPMREFRIYNEDNSLIFSRDSISPYYTSDLNASDKSYNTDMIYKTSEGWKMRIVRSNYDSPNKDFTEIYSLPGTAVVSGLVQPSFKELFSIPNPYPNPTTSEVKIDFKLPDNVREGEIHVFDTNGNPIKTLEVDNTFGNVILNYTGLPSGTYYYLIKAGDSVSETKKVIVLP